MAFLANRAQVLARKYLEALLPQRFRHTKVVAERAKWLASRLLDPDRAEVVVAAAWLHDVGYSPDLVDTGFHPIDGARYVAGAPDLYAPSLAGLVAHHTGAVFEARERDLEEALHKFPVPDAVELAILSCADLCAGPDGAATDPGDRIDDVLARYPYGHPVHQAISRCGQLLVAQARLLLAAAEAITAPLQVVPLPDWAERDDPFAPHWDATWNRERYRITATRAGGVDGKPGVKISLTDPKDPLNPTDAAAMADDLRAAAAAAAGKPLCWSQYRAFSTDVGVAASDRRGRRATDGRWLSATFRLAEILEFQWDLTSEGCAPTVDQRIFTTLSDVTEWTELVGRWPGPPRPPS